MGKNGTKQSRVFRVRNSIIQGKGVFASQRIRPGRRIIEYIGEKIDNEEVNKRYDEDTMERHHTFLFEIDDEVTLDAAVGGNDARFFNHSCNPNCEAVLEDDQVFIEAIANIQPGVELTYDYNFQITGRVSKKEMAYYGCKCGSENCRGTILNFPDKKKKRKSAKSKKSRRR